MDYEDYRDRMVAQGRTPVARDRYASQVEAGYMLANLTQDEFCQLPDRVIAELSRAANRLDVYDRRADEAARECERLRARVAVLETIEEERDAARAEAEKLAAAHARREAHDDHMGNAEGIGILARMISTRRDLTLDEITALKIGMRCAKKRVVDHARNKCHRRERLAAREAAEPAPEVAE